MRSADLIDAHICVQSINSTFEEIRDLEKEREVKKSFVFMAGYVSITVYPLNATRKFVFSLGFMPCTCIFSNFAVKRHPTEAATLAFRPGFPFGQR